MSTGSQILVESEKIADGQGGRGEIREAVRNAIMGTEVGPPCQIGILGGWLDRYKEKQPNSGKEEVDRVLNNLVAMQMESLHATDNFSKGRGGKTLERQEEEKAFLALLNRAIWREETGYEYPERKTPTRERYGYLHEREITYEARQIGTKQGEQLMRKIRANAREAAQKAGLTLPPELY